MNILYEKESFNVIETLEIDFGIRITILENSDFARLEV